MKKALPASNTLSRRKLLIILALWAVFLTYTYAYKPLVARQEKQRFESALVELQKIAESVQEKSGKATSVETVKSCSYSSAKYSKGSLSCSVGLVRTTRELSPEQATSLMTSASKLLKESPKGLLSGDARFLDGDSQSNRYSHPLSASTDLDCLVEYRYKASEYITAFSCSKDAKAEHFPVK